MAFSFLQYLFSFQRYLRFCIMQIRKVMMSLIVPQKDEALNHEYLLEYLSRVLQSWHH